ELRPVTITPDFVRKADGSCLIEMGGTRVICTASFTRGVPAWLTGKGAGWLTAEYGMLPASTGGRKSRPIAKSDGRATEIQRLIGRTLRTVINMKALGENTIYLDCDVLEADGGTRTASITGAYVALALAIGRAARAGNCDKSALCSQVAAVSTGIIDGRPMLDLNYPEDSAADVDMNVAMTSGGKFVEVQATAERAAFDATELAQMLDLARRGIRKLMKLQQQAVEKGLRR
ncbi:MAG: ribonuclease PH, partial [Planctomycetaceae bacterium]